VEPFTSNHQTSSVGAPHCHGLVLLGVAARSQTRQAARVEARTEHRMEKAMLEGSSSLQLNP
jgi:hypothetical protein